MSSQINFGYPWFLSYGHLVILVVALAFWLLGRARKWSRARMILIAAVTLWSAAAFLVTRGMDVNGRLALPTERFLHLGHRPRTRYGRRHREGPRSWSWKRARKPRLPSPWTCLRNRMRNILDPEKVDRRDFLSNLKAAGWRIVLSSRRATCASSPLKQPRSMDREHLRHGSPAP